ESATVTAGQLDPITVQLAPGRSQPLSQDEFHALLEQLARTAGGARIIKTFQAATSSQPVQLDEQQRRLLVTAISAWGQAFAARHNVPAMPEAVWQLRHALMLEPAPR